MSESHLLAEILLECSRDRVRLWRQNAGRAWGGKILYQDRSKLILSPYYAVKLGPPGMSDAGGLVSELITPEMIGQPIARYVGIETKTPTGRVTPEQRSFIAMVNEFGGRAGVARSVEDAQRILRGE